MKLLYASLLLWVFFIDCSTAAAQTDSVPAHDSLYIESVQLGEKRIINIWTPPQYAAGNDSFAVIYMADGGILEDFPHIANTIAALIKNNSIPPVILVGIENTQRRRDLTGPTEIQADKKIAAVVGGAAAFRRFITEELFSAIAGKYRVKKEKGIIGESLAGLFVIETFLLKPDLFDFYIAMDPSLWWNNHYLTRTAKEHLAKFPSTKKRLWFAGSGTPDISTYTKRLADILQSNKPPSLTWIYSDEPKEKHHTIFRATKEKALQWVLTGK